MWSAWVAVLGIHDSEQCVNDENACEYGCFVYMCTGVVGVRMGLCSYECALVRQILVSCTCRCVFRPPCDYIFIVSMVCLILLCGQNFCVDVIVFCVWSAVKCAILMLGIDHY